MASKARLLIASGLLASAALAGAQTAAGSPVDQQRLARVQDQVVAFFQKMADLTCTENVVQEKLRPNGHVETSAQSRYDYLIMVQAGPDDFAMNESRIEAAGAPHKPLPLLVTNGFSMLLLVFHPYYEKSFRIASAPPQSLNGRALLPLRFDHIAGTRSPAALSLRGRVYPLDLTGTAWIDPGSSEIVAIDAGLGGDMSDLGLRSLHIHVDYQPISLRGATGMPLPQRAVIDVETPRQHWRNTHDFTDYKSFSANAQQDTKVRVIAKEPAPQDGDPPKDTTTPQEEP